jgi:CMP-N,N'-diacetyllegionaminic acid synthase
VIRAALVPARGGSKGIPRKNIANLAGRPLIAWTLEAATVAAVFDRIIVSTDDREIAAIAREYGGETPFIRPAGLADDFASTRDVVMHALSSLSAEGCEVDELVILQPTSPFRTAADIIASINMRDETQVACVISVVKGNYSPKLIFDRDAAGRLTSSQTKSEVTRRQDAQMGWRPNGAIYLVTTDHLRAGGGWYDDGTYGYLMPEERSLDIDTQWDLHLAQLIAADLMSTK